MVPASTITDDLLERELELAAVDPLLEEARGGHGRVLVIEGPPGIGRSRLLREVASRATAAGMGVARARGSELERDFPFGVPRQLFEPHVAAVSDSDRAALLAGAARFAEPALSEDALAGEEPA